MATYIVGWAHMPFGKHDTLDLEALVTGVAGDALVHAGVDAGDIQVPGAELAGVFSMGGSAVASYVSILERAR